MLPRNWLHLQNQSFVAWQCDARDDLQGLDSTHDSPAISKTHLFLQENGKHTERVIVYTLGCASKISAILEAVEFCCCTRRCIVFMPRMIRYAAFCLTHGTYEIHEIKCINKRNSWEGQVFHRVKCASQHMMQIANFWNHLQWAADASTKNLRQGEKQSLRTKSTAK